MSEKNKLQQILDALKISVQDTDVFEKDITSILQMFEKVKEADISTEGSVLLKKKTNLNDLRADTAVPSNFRPEMSGKYYSVPNVSKKG